MHTQCVAYTVSPYHDCHWASSRLRQCCCSLWNSQRKPSMDWRNWAHSLGCSQELHFTRAVQLGWPHFQIHWPDWVTCFMALRVEDNSISHPPPTQSQGASFQLSLTSRSLLQGFILAYKFPFLLIYIFPCTRLYIHPHPFLWYLRLTQHSCKIFATVLAGEEEILFCVVAGCLMYCHNVSGSFLNELISRIVFLLHQSPPAPPLNRTISSQTPALSPIRSSTLNSVLPAQPQTFQCASFKACGAHYSSARLFLKSHLGKLRSPFWRITLWLWFLFIKHKGLIYIS